MILAETIAYLANQKRRPDKIIVAYADPADVGEAPLLDSSTSRSSKRSWG